MTDTPSNRHVAEAVRWLVKFETGDVNAEDQIAFTRWQAESPQHALAWERLGRASQQFSIALNLNSEQVLHSLETAERQLQQKRRTLKTLASVGGLGISLWLTRDITGVAQTGRYLYGQTMADISTTAGEQKSLTLQDGGKLILNTQSALDVDFSARPELALHYGELAIANSGGAQVRTSSHLFSPTAGSEFTLYGDKQLCHLQVITGQVNCILAGSDEYQITTGQSLIQEGDQIRRSTLNPHSLSWRLGLITAERTQLGDFIPQLARYRSGHIGLAEEITGLTFSGSFPIANTDAILDNLCQILPIRQQRISRYWVRLVAA